MWSTMLLIHRHISLKNAIFFIALVFLWMKRLTARPTGACAGLGMLALPCGQLDPAKCSTNNTVFTEPMGFEDIPYEYIAIQTNAVGSVSKCTLDVTKKQLSFRNMCPTYEVETIDNNRKPARIREKRCCDRAIRPDTNGILLENCLSVPQFFGVVSTLPRTCEAVKIIQTVVRKVSCGNGMCVCRQVYEPVQVGCACAYTRVPISISGGSRGPLPET